MVRLAGKWCAVARRLHGPSSLRCRDGSDANPRDCSPIICFFAPKAGGTRLGTAMAQQENGAKEAEQRRKPSDCVNNRSGHLASQRRVRSRDPLARNHEDEFVPDGQITKNSSTPIAKNIPLSPSGKSVLSARAIPFRKRGVGHRHERWDGVRWTQQRRARLRSQGGSPVSDHAARRTNDAVAYGKAVWSWHPLLVSSWRRFFEPDRAFDQPLIRLRR